MQQRYMRLNAIALAVTLTYALVVLDFVSKKTVVSPVVDLIFAYVTSAGFYQLIVDLIFKLVEASPKLLRWYWGRRYLAGLWSYTYTLDGNPDHKVYFGVWRIEQNLYSTTIVGFGLSDNFEARSHVRSVTDLIENGPVCEVVNIRSDSVDSASEVYSRTTMYFELSPDRFFPRPIRIRGKTFIYGGPRSGGICNNFFLKHESARTEQDVIDQLRMNLETYGQVHPIGLMPRNGPRNTPPTQPGSSGKTERPVVHG